MTAGGAIRSCSPTTTKVGGSCAEVSEWPVYAITTAVGLGGTMAPALAALREPIAAAMRAPAELPHSE